MKTGDFVRREIAGLPLYLCKRLEHMPGVRHAFSTRAGGCSALPDSALNLGAVSWDNKEAVRENRRRLLAAIGLTEFPLATLSQIHSDRIHIIEDPTPDENARPQADALVTRRDSVALAVQVADCFPILMADDNDRVVAAIHAGWRGAVQRIAAKTVDCMRRNFGSDPASVVVAIGPGIRACCFEVGPDVLVRFQEEFPETHLWTRSHVDLPGALRAQLLDAGVQGSNIYDLGLCTRCNQAEFFSYRGEGNRTGRMMGVIAVESPIHRTGSREGRLPGGG